MDKEFLQKLDELYLQYGYDPRTDMAARVYLFTKSIYNGADIINTGSDEDVEQIKKELAQSGYAVRVRNFASIENAEDRLFKDFFKSESVIDNLRRRYDFFVEKLMDNLPKDSRYEYIRCPYELVEYKFEKQESTSISIEADDTSSSLIPDIVDRINNHVGPLLIIIEAAAGYGKTCSAYELLREFISRPSDKLPFFTELSRDRRATIFKHILQFEIEEQFSNRVNSNVVVDQIKKGRIPLIIDGFDELISKDFSFSNNQFEQVESMLSTIVDLLTDNAKIIITSRKTAIFNSEEFHNWMIDRNIDYTLSKITLSEPSIENWLDEGRLGVIQNNNFPVEQIANPVLLTYLRYIDFEDLKSIISADQSIVDRYFSFLLEREQNRQNLLIEPETQLRIFRKLVRFLTEWDVKSESKDFIKDLLLDYNKKILEETRKKYAPDKRPRIDQLADILSNHAFLDRKENGNIGIINEFVLGTLIGENLILGKYAQYDEEFYKKLTEMFASLAIQAFQIQPKFNKEKIWTVFNEFDFPYDQQLFFKIDIDFKNEIIRNYSHATLSDFTLDNYNFFKHYQFDSTIFTACTFKNCQFSFKAFNKSSFVNCRFFNCFLLSEGLTYSDEYFTVYGCFGDNDFIQNIINSDDDNADEGVAVSLEKEILSLYFRKGSPKPRFRQLSHIKQELIGFDYRLVSKTIYKLKGEDMIYLDGDLTHLTKKGISYYHDQYSTN